MLNSFIAYIGPDVMLPFASVLAGIFGIFLVGWRWFLGLFKRAWYFITRRTPKAEPAPTAAAQVVKEAQEVTK